MIIMTTLAPNVVLNQAIKIDAQWYKRSIVIAGILSCVIHIFILSIKKPEPVITPKHLKAPLAVVLVNSQSQVAPVSAKRLAQHNLNGGGQQDAPVMASAVSPMLPGLAEKINTLQEEQNRLLSSMREEAKQQKKTTPGKTSMDKEATDPLEAELAKRVELESQRPRKAIMTSTSAKSVVYAEYYNTMRNKVEAYGTQYFPRSNGKPLYGSLIIMVSIDREGKIIAKPKVEKSSGNAELDRQTIAIIEACAPFEKFSPTMRAQLDVIDWIASFAFVKGSGQTQLELKMTNPKP
jgi:protein TonB